MSSPEVQQIRVTPEIAVKWLDKNTVNRSINQYRVYSYAADMKAGRWKLNGDTIRFAKSGVLLDGQHRLWAVVEAGVAVDFLVAFNLDEDVRTTIDTGRPRSTADFFRMVDGTAKAAKVVALIKVIETFFTSQRTPMGYDVAKARYELFKEGIDWSFKAFPAGGKIDCTPVRAAMSFAYPAAKGKAIEFAQKVRSGAGLLEGDPALALRNYLLERQPVVKDDTRIVAIKTMSAFYAYVTGTYMTKVYAKDDGINHFLKLYPTLQKASPAKQLAAQPVTAPETDLDIEVRRVQATIDVPRPWTKKGVTLRRKAAAAQP